MKRIGHALIISATAVWLVQLLYFGRTAFLRPFDFRYFASIYSGSQYIEGPNSKRGIGDDGLYAFAGYYYLFQKGDVASVNFEHPPLGKYLIGTSILLTGNERFINIFYFAGLLILTYFIGKIILKNSILAACGVLLLALDPLFTDKLFYSLLNLPFTVFVVLAVYCFLKGQKNRYWFIASNLAWGGAFSTRFFPSFMLLFPYIVVWLYFNNRKNIRFFLTTSSLIPVVYIISHTAFFLYHPSVVDFLRHKKWMLSWFTGTTVSIANIWRNVFTGYFLDPTGKLVRNDYWTIVIPVVILLAILPVKVIGSYWKTGKGFLYGLCIIYLLYATLLTNGDEKFLIPIYPLLIILFFASVRDFHSIIGKCRKAI